MLVQDRSPPPKLPTSINGGGGGDDNSKKKKTKKLSFSPNSLLDLSALTPKILIVSLLLLAAAAAIFLLPSLSPSAALVSFQRANSSPSPPRIPKINFNSVPPLPPSHLPSFKSPNWIAVSVSSAPTPALLRLSRLPNWQLLAVATSLAPADFSLKGAIFLSLDLQSQLGFRVTGLLPYSSHLRKTLAYLFAIQHGARRIFDADDRAEMLADSDPFSRHFDLDLSHHEVLLQYSHENPNRTVVNPYIHFGQRSVWPRGLPLENVPEIEHEEFYTEVFGGRQFIQQGLSNGLPDVDSVFYFTRKSSGLESFDIRFDQDAPKVALPQGVMVPVNSFNTLFHSQAFWGLMLPVGVSSMASDVLRGYWAQRILWEIGGFVAVYPPTIKRADNVGSYPFAEEKDLHVNVGRLVEFLVRWRSKKATLFERILDLSYAMAEEGFWTELDVELTAAWLQDLLAVGYQQPRLMSLELDRPRATIGHGDRREFVPKKLPSVHLGVEEVGSVNYEIGNLIRWRKYFGNVVLVMYCSGSVERTALEWRLLYGRIFKTVIILSGKEDSDLVVERGDLPHAYK